MLFSKLLLVSVFGAPPYVIFDLSNMEVIIYSTYAIILLRYFLPFTDRYLVRRWTC